MLLNSLAIVYRSSCRCLSTSKFVANKRSHYEVLGVTTKATQKDIKGAYFRLCMVHHPDQKENKTHDQKFLEIQAAYEVLGNVRLRKLYDKGVSSPRQMKSGTSSSDDLNPTSKFYKSRDKVTRPASTSYAPIYNFDEWTRAHYASTFKRDMERKKKEMFNQNLRRQDEQGLESVQIIGVVGVFFFTLVYMAYRSRNEHDIVTIDENQRKKLPARVMGG